MPEHEKAVNRLVRGVIGEHIFDGSTGEPHRKYEIMTGDELQDVRYACRELYLRVMDSIDWSRVLLEARGRCLALKHDHRADDQCGESMLAALTAATWGGTPGDHWEEYPDPELPEMTDWVTPIAEGKRHRSIYDPSTKQFREARMYAGWSDPNRPDFKA